MKTLGSKCQNVVSRMNTSNFHSLKIKEARNSGFGQIVFLVFEHSYQIPRCGGFLFHQELKRFLF